MNKVGIILEHYGLSELAIRTIKQVNELPYNIDVVGFYEIMQKPCMIPRFALMQISESFSFDGTLIATNFKSAKQLVTCPGPKKKIYYVWDLELYDKVFDFNEAARIFRSGMRIICRNSIHKGLLDNNFNIDCEVIDNFNLGMVLKGYKNEFINQRIF